MASNPPRFASFRPKPKPAAPERRDPSPPPAKKPKFEQPPPTDKPYRSDRRGDPNIVRFGGLNPYDIPAYRRSGHGYVLGLENGQRIDRDQSSNKHIVITPVSGPRQERLLIAKQSDTGKTIVPRLIVPKEQKKGAAADFIAVDDGRKRKRNEDDDGGVNEDYRSIHARRPSFVEQDDLDTPLSPEEEQQFGSPTTGRNAELMRQTREHPESLKAWLDFSEHQEAMIRQDYTADHDLSERERSKLAEVRINILEEALGKIGKSEEDHIQLYQHLIQEAQRAWTEADISAQWSKILAKHPRSPALWLQYLDYCQSNFTRFKFEKCKNIYFQCFAALATRPDSDLLESVLHIFIRMTSMIQQAGYQELAIAIWQAVLEHSIYVHRQNIKSGFDSFEDFWDCEVPRIGEMNAKGWKDSNIDDESPNGPSSPLSENPSLSWFQDYKAREVDASVKLRYPGRAVDHAGGDDPHHYIFFSDVEPFTTILQAHTPLKSLMDAFLCFCGLPPLPQASTRAQKWWSDPFLQHTSLKHIIPLKSNNALSKMYCELGKTPLQSFQMTTELLFAQPFSMQNTRLDAGFVRRVLKLVILASPMDETLGQYLLAFEAVHFPADASKSARTLLQANPTSLSLYNAYGHVEKTRKKYEKANKGFSAALSMQKSSFTFVSSDNLKLLESWIWSALDEGNHVEALWRLTSPRGQFTDRTDSTSTPNERVLLQTRAALSETCETALLAHDYASAVSSTALLALLAYLCDNQNVEAALSAHQHLNTWFTSSKMVDSSHAELHAQSIACFLLHHVQNAPLVKPVLIRKALETHLSHFPNNTILLSLYAANEARFSIDDRVRGIMSQTVLQNSHQSVAGLSFAIHYEKLRGHTAGSTSHTIRALYKRATARDAPGANCPAIWKSALQFELLQLQMGKEKGTAKKARKDGKKRTWETHIEQLEDRVKDTFYNGLRHVPWCKDFAMLAFTDCSEVFSEEELWRVHCIMQEKELRLYVEIDNSKVGVRWTIS